MRKTFILLSIIMLSACQPKHTQSNESEMTNESYVAPVTMHQEHFGKLTDGRNADLFILKNKNGMEVRITNYGGIITHLLTPDKNGHIDDIVLGFDSLAPYLEEHPYFGAIIGRYGNRVANGKFSLNNKEYKLATNNGPNHLHGGPAGFHTQLWDADIIEGKDDLTLRLSRTSPSGEEGYPGTLNIQVDYTLNPLDELHITYSATTNATTPLNLTNHTYFNLTGDASQSILDHEIQINADSFIPVNELLIPTGEIATLDDSPLDFRTSKKIGRDIEVEKRQLLYGKGFDHCFVLKKDRKLATPQLAATAYEPISGRAVEVWTTEPGIQFYSGNFLDGSLVGKNGMAYQKRTGFCLETQHYPDSPNQPNFPSTLISPEHPYHSKTIFKFLVR